MSQPAKAKEFQVTQYQVVDYAEYKAQIGEGESVVYTDDPRETVAQYFEDMTRRIRSGELYGGRIEWSENLPAMVRVETFPQVYWDEKYQEHRRLVRLTRTELKPTSERVSLVKEG